MTRGPWKLDGHESAGLAVEERDGKIWLTVMSQADPLDFCSIGLTELQVESLARALGVARARLRGERAKGWP